MVTFIKCTEFIKKIERFYEKLCVEASSHIDVAMLVAVSLRVFVQLHCSSLNELHSSLKLMSRFLCFDNQTDYMYEYDINS